MTTEIREKREFIKKLKEIVEYSPNYLTLENYNKVCSICTEFEDKYPELELTEHIYEENFITTEEDEKIAIENNSDSIDRLRCFIGDTYSSDIYKIDGYGNLSNVSNDDISDLCDELVDIVEKSIDEELNM